MERRVVCNCGYAEAGKTEQPFQAHAIWCATRFDPRTEAEKKAEIDARSVDPCYPPGDPRRYGARPADSATGKQSDANDKG